LGENVDTILSLKRRPPAKKRGSMTEDSSVASVSSVDEAPIVVMERPRKRRNSVKTESKDVTVGKSKKDRQKKRGSSKFQKVRFPSVTVQVQAEEFDPPCTRRMDAAAPDASSSPDELNYAESKSFLTASSMPVRQVSATTSYDSNQSLPKNIASSTAASAASQIQSNNSASTTATTANASGTSRPLSATLAQLLSTTLPPTDVLFNDDFGDEFANSNNANGHDGGEGTWVTDQGRCLSHNSLVDLAMFY
jgi:hypothetical protein